MHIALEQHLHHAGKYPRIFVNFPWQHYMARWQKAWFAVPYRFGLRLNRLWVLIFQLPIPLASCSCAPCISATSPPCRKIPANFGKFSITALYGGVGEGLISSPVEVWKPFEPTACFNISTLHPLSFMFMCSLHQCNICTVPENAREYSRIFHDGTIRSDGKGLVCSPVQVWTPFEQTAGYHISTPHPVSFMFMCTLHQCTMVKTTREFSQISRDGTIRCGGIRLTLQARYRFEHLLHRLRVHIFQLVFPLASCLCAPCISATSAPRWKTPTNFRKFPMTNCTEWSYQEICCCHLHLV